MSNKPKFGGYRTQEDICESAELVDMAMTLIVEVSQMPIGEEGHKRISKSQDLLSKVIRLLERHGAQTRPE